ncbi:uncharacterized protein LOC135841941 [Planococcus citri]|uniref:uncharacterized protein LOC135841941 n=1 Tax=Planococcus citri TaxID=170843 RepID=UPI0031F98EAA
MDDRPGDFDLIFSWIKLNTPVIIYLGQGYGYMPVYTDRLDNNNERGEDLMLSWYAPHPRTGEYTNSNVHLDEIRPIWYRDAARVIHDKNRHYYRDVDFRYNLSLHSNRDIFVFDGKGTDRGLVKADKDHNDGRLEAVLRRLHENCLYHGVPMYVMENSYEFVHENDASSGCSN